MTPRDPFDRGTAGPDWIAAQIARAARMSRAANQPQAPRPKVNAISEALRAAMPAIAAAVHRAREGGR